MRHWIAAAALAMLALCPGDSFAASGQGNQAWWIENYGVVTTKDNPLVGRAEKVFGKVMSAADKNGSRFPRFVVIRADSRDAFVIEDGTVVLTGGALDRCYREVTVETGDAQLAFILGHELSHLSNDDFWDRSAYFAVQKFAGGDNAAKDSLTEILKRTTDITKNANAMEVAKKKELQADSSGIFYMMMAGFDPGTIIGPGGVNFLEDLSYRVFGAVAIDGDGSHPSSRNRGEFLRSRLADVVDDLSFFRFGVRLLQRHRYDEALLLLEKFRQKYPGREVFNDIGLCHYMLAVRALVQCDDPRTLRFRLSTAVDSETYASRIRTRGGSDTAGSRGSSGSASCSQAEKFAEELRQAVENFQMASKKDPLYVPVRVNLASAYIMSGEYLKAMAEADKAAEVAPGDRGATNNKAVALYLFGKVSEIDTGGKALSLLESISGTEALYNRAVVLAESGREGKAREAMAAFLAAGGRGPYSGLLTGMFGILPETFRDSKPPIREATAPPKPVPLGMLTASTRKALGAAREKQFEIGPLRGSFFESPGCRVLVIKNFVEVVESDLEKPEDPAEFVRKYGPPTYVDETAGGRLLVYPGFAADVTGDKVTRYVFLAR